MPQRKPKEPYRKGKEPTLRNISQDVKGAVKELMSPDTVDDPARALRRLQKRASSYLSRGGYDIDQPVVTDREYRRATLPEGYRRVMRSATRRSQRR